MPKHFKKLYHDDQIEAQDPTVSIADIELFQWHELSNELHVIASNNSSDNILFIVEVQIFVLVEASDILLGLLNCICVHGLADI